MNKQKKEPMRTCTGCRQSKPKKELIRIVKFEDEVFVDFTGRRNGRGAYICPDINCLEKAIKSKGINRTLKVSKIDSDIYENLKSQLEEHNG